MAKRRVSHASRGRWSRGRRGDRREVSGLQSESQPSPGLFARPVFLKPCLGLADGPSTAERGWADPVNVAVYWHLEQSA